MATALGVTYTDNQINELVLEPKPLSKDWRRRFRMMPKRGHNERDLELKCASGNEYRLILRQSKVNFLDFSVILAVHVPLSNRLFRLQRYNGKSHQHTNHLEGHTFYDFHIHKATERYQLRGESEDAYAEVTNRYIDFNGAVHCMLTDANFLVSDSDQLSMF